MILKKYLRNILLLILLKPLVTVAQTFPDYQVTAYDTASSGYYFLCPLKFGSNPAFFNLERKIPMPGNVLFEVAYLAAHSNATQHAIARQQLTDVFVYLLDA